MAHLGTRRRHGLRLTGLALFAALAAQAGASEISETLEKWLGEYTKYLVESSVPVEDDPLLQGIVEGLGGDLAAVGGRRDVRHRFRVLDTDEVNALAGPAGFIWVTKGALRYVESPDELAAIMGHEVAHVTHRHGWEAFRQDIAFLALLLSAPSSVPVDALRWADSAYFVAGLQMSRSDERQADEEGVRFGLAAGYDARAAADFFSRLLEEEGGDLSRLEIYFSTHPSHTERIERIAGHPDLARSAECLLRIGDGYLNRRLFASALACYDAIPVEDREMRSLAHSAVACAFLGDFDQAAALLEEAASSGCPVPANAELEDARAVVASLREALPVRSLAGPSEDRVQELLRRLDEGERALTACLEDLRPEEDKMAARREATARNLNAVTQATEAYARMEPASRRLLVGSERAGTPQSALGAARAAAAGTDARIADACETLQNRLALSAELSRSLRSGCASAAVADLAERCAAENEALAQATRESIRLSEGSADALEHAADAMAEACADGGIPWAAGAANLAAAVTLDAQAEDALARAEISNALLRISLEAIRCPVSPEATYEAAAAVMRLSPEELAQARRLTADAGMGLLIAATAKQTGRPAAASAAALLGSQDRGLALRSLGADAGNLAIALRLAARALTRERVAIDALNGGAVEG